MILWDDINSEQYVRIKSIEKLRIKYEDFILSSTIAELEAAIELYANDLLDDNILYIHIFSKPTTAEPELELKYVVWIGEGTPIILPGATYWWESVE